MENNTLIKIISILFVPLPLLLISGPFLPDLLVSIISLLFLIYCFKQKKFHIFKNIYFYIFFIFWIYVVLNSLFINFNLTSLKISFFYIRFGIFIIAVAYVLNFEKNVFNNFFYVMLFSFSVLIIDGFIQYFFGNNIFGFKINSIGRVSSFFNDELILGSYLSRLFPLFSGCIFF